MPSTYTLTKGLTDTAAELVDRLVEDTCDWAGELARGWAGSVTYLVDPTDPKADEVTDWCQRHGAHVVVELHVDDEDAWATYTAVAPTGRVEVPVRLVNQYHLRNDLQAEAATEAAVRITQALGL